MSLDETREHSAAVKAIEELKGGPEKIDTGVLEWAIQRLHQAIALPRMRPSISK